MSLRKRLMFCAPRRVDVQEESLSAPSAGQLLVETAFSAISPGTEMLVYRGQFPDVTIDSNFEAMGGKFAYPLAYGYACVGRVLAAGAGVESNWIGKQVFSFQPHCSHFYAPAHALLCLPEGLSLRNACFFPNMETAVNLVQDAAPLLGERVLVLGQGIIGLLTSALLAEFPLECLVTADLFPARRAAAQSLGISAALDPAAPDFNTLALAYLKTGADLALEISGAPEALNLAIALTTFSGRIVIGSWYGQKRAPLDLGGSFHRSRIRLISSQVSTIAPELSARWDKARRYEQVWQALARVRPEKWITHSFRLDQAAQAYRLLDEKPDQAIQVVFEY